MTGILIGWLSGTGLAWIIIITFILLDVNLWNGNYKEFMEYSDERPTWMGSGFYMAYRNWRRE